ncbi:MAG: NAD(P)H-hydrate dehydratase [bacterium]
MRFLTVEQMRAADHAAVKEKKIPGMVLMNRAGTALARAVEKVAALRGVKSVVVVAGHGNNGGDVCVAARCLYEDGFHVQVIMTCVPATLKGMAREAWDEMRTRGVPYVVLAAAESWTEDVGVFSGMVLRHGMIVDGVLGTGCKGVPTGVVDKAIRWINGMRRHALVVAADLPSGMNGDTGEAAGSVVQADVTVTFARPKRCFLNQKQAGLVGHLVVSEIGIPDEICDRGASEVPCQLIALPELAHRFTMRERDAHKGAFGHVCVLGGAAGFPHAPVLAALGAARSGAGLLTLAAPAQSAWAAAAHVPEAMLAALETPQGELSVEALKSWGRDLAGFDAIVAGPGLTQSERARGVIAHLLATYTGRLVLDADGLNLLAGLRADGWHPQAGQRLVLTPHPGEAARLLGLSVQEIQGDRLAAVRQLADQYQAVVILKGAGTLVCGPDGVPWLNLTGNPGMAAGGMGDVLAGMVGALWAQGLEAVQAATTAVWAHGTAGDCAAFAESQTALSATSLSARLGTVFQMIERKSS